MERKSAGVLHDLLFAATNFDTELERGRYAQVGTRVHGAYKLECLDETRPPRWREGVSNGSLARAQDRRKSMRSWKGRADQRLIADGDVE
jgi:hypothetical protein